MIVEIIGFQFATTVVIRLKRGETIPSTNIDARIAPMQIAGAAALFTQAAQITYWGVICVN